MIYSQHLWSGQAVAASGERVSGGREAQMGSRAPHGYGPHQPGWPPDLQNASTWPSLGRTRAYPPDSAEPSRPLQPLYPPAPVVPQAQQRVVYVVHQPPSTPVIVEVIGGLFGFYG